MNDVMFSDVILYFIVSCFYWNLVRGSVQSYSIDNIQMEIVWLVPIGNDDCCNSPYNRLLP